MMQRLLPYCKDSYSVFAKATEVYGAVILRVIWQTYRQHNLSVLLNYPGDSCDAIWKSTEVIIFMTETLPIRLYRGEKTSETWSSIYFAYLLGSYCLSLSLALRGSYFPDVSEALRNMLDSWGRFLGEVAACFDSPTAGWHLAHY